MCGLANYVRDRYSKIITLRISKELDEVLTEICKEYGYSSKSEFVREAVEDYIKYLSSLITDDEGLEVVDFTQAHKVIMI
ncbi:MAG: ribbon-helix-helix domain-containing protein [Desulfurococcaceae archaeon]|nr:ribbon-helix-helix domain-containing protein [Desulfurococcaceae archaeon]